MCTVEPSTTPGSARPTASSPLGSTPRRRTVASTSFTSQ